MNMIVALNLVPISFSNVLLDSAQAQNANAGRNVSQGLAVLDWRSFFYIINFSTTTRLQI